MKQRTELNWNNRSGINGVSWNAATESWRVRIRVEGKTLDLGLREDILHAAYLRLHAEEKYLGGILGSTAQSYVDKWG